MKSINTLITNFVKPEIQCAIHKVHTLKFAKYLTFPLPTHFNKRVTSLKQ